eukprot:CAMPEP_0115385552 /NCGR_PEP_ID=MMETSP0271-20121206/7689_1 /TAXON_ID=71861 /ORGANISM="Scrippsiella trochoidea, Strain CCMP3099" /LENGTH=200 /DNA_ID=CAMNT_0002808955 /DNA_START=1 /DNA_END=603 /DNA_ORIENTATION=-
MAPSDSGPAKIAAGSCRGSCFDKVAVATPTTPRPACASQEPCELGSDQPTREASACSVTSDGTRRPHRATPPSHRSKLWRLIGRDGVAPVESELLAKRRKRSADMQLLSSDGGSCELPSKLVIELWRLPPPEEFTWKTRWPKWAACFRGLQRLAVDMCSDVGIEACELHAQPEEPATQPRASLLTSKLGKTKGKPGKAKV